MFDELHHIKLFSSIYLHGIVSNHMHCVVCNIYIYIYINCFCTYSHSAQQQLMVSVDNLRCKCLFLELNQSSLFVCTLVNSVSEF